MTKREVIRGMIREIEARGWIQHDYESEKGICLLQAVFAVLPGSDEDPIVNALVVRIQGAIKGATGFESLAKWNDQEGRTKQEVLQMLRGLAR